MKLNEPFIDQLRKIYRTRRAEIAARLEEFTKLWSDGSDKEIFAELAFCLFTPQSKAKACWAAVLTIKDRDLLLSGTADEIKRRLLSVRFHNKKAQYLVEARNLFFGSGRISIKPFLKGFADIYECRDWLVKNIKGFGYKEASHFLRNIGFGEKIAILDRHILRNLSGLGIIEGIPESLGRTKYLKTERKMSDFAQRINIPLSHLDLLLWCKETGEIFK